MNQHLDESLWQKFAITEELWQRYEEQQSKLVYDLSWIPQVLLATIDDSIPRWDLVPSALTHPPLSRIYSLQYSVHVSDAVGIVRQGGLCGLPDKRNGILQENGLLVVPTRPFYNSNDGPIAFGFHTGDMLDRFKVYRIDLLHENDQPLIRLMLSMRDLSDSFVPIDCSHYGNPVLRAPIGSGLMFSTACQYELLIEGNIPLSECWEIAIDPHYKETCSLYGAACPEKDQDANVARILALAITSTDRECVRLLKQNIAYFGPNYLTSFRFWLKNLNIEFTGQEAHQGMLHNAFVELANGNYDLVVQKLRTSSLNTVFDFLADRVVNLFGFSNQAVRLYLYG